MPNPNGRRKRGAGRGGKTPPRGSSGDSAGSAVSGFRPYTARWFRKAFESPSPIQELAWPAIRRGESSLLLAPTGSGKTLAAFLCAIDELYERAEAGELADAIHVLYVTPLKALGNDIHRNLVEPLAQIQQEAGKPLPEIRHAVRTGDTPQGERARMLRRPPHILITTPESLYILLAGSKITPALRTIRTVIVDEVHYLCDNKRGAHLAVSLERLEEMTEGPLQRIGCSATLNPLDEIAAFLVGRDGQGERRPCTIVDAGMRKDLDVEVVAPLRDFLEASNTALWSSAYELLLKEIGSHQSTLIFSNSRYKTERTALRLGELADEGTRIGSHHGSMSRELRLEMEDALKGGDLDALVATSSLELGIDVGSVNLVYQLESPKSVATGLQRIGRAGHLLDATSKGRILVFERDELLEAAAICRAMLDGDLEPVQLARGCLDVLAQQMVGCVAAGASEADALFELIRRAYPYTDLSREQFDGVLAMLAGEHSFQMSQAPRPLVLWDRANGRLSPTRSSQHVSLMCVGTIPENWEYEVVVDSSHKKVGAVDSQFADDCLEIGDIFALGSSSWRLVGVRRNRLLVEEAPGETPSVPWWQGPMASRTPQVGVRVGQMRRRVAEKLDDPGLHDWLQQEYHLNPDAATAIVDYIREQRAAAGVVPDERSLLVESWKDELGRRNVILHSPFGARINQTWGQAIRAFAKSQHGQEWTATASNDVLVLTHKEGGTPPLQRLDAPTLLGGVETGSTRSLLMSGAQDAVSFGSGFHDAAVCAFQILRAWQGKRVAPWLQHYRAEELYEAAKGATDYPILDEVRRQYQTEWLDVDGLAHVLGQIEAGDIELLYREVESPSPFAHGMLIQSEYVLHEMGRSRRAHLLRLHRQVLQEVLSQQEMAELLDPRAIEGMERRLQHRSETTQARTSDELAQVVRDLGDVPATPEALQAVTDGDPVALLRPLVRQRRVVAVHVPAWDQDPIRLVAADTWRLYRDAAGPARGKARPSLLLPRFRAGAMKSFEPVAAGKVIARKWQTQVAQGEARRAIIERYLRTRGPVTQYEIMNHTGWPIGAVEGVLEELVQSGTVARGTYTSEKPSPQWVDRGNLEEIHRLTMGYLKRELAACAPYEVVDFTTRWQHLHPTTRLEGLDGLRAVIGQLQGVEVIQGVLETEVLPGRVRDYRPEMLDQLIASGEVCWRRVSTRGINRGRITLCFRRDMEWLARGSPLEFDPEAEVDVDIPESMLAVRRFFQAKRSAFFGEVLEATGIAEDEALRAVWHLAWCGEVHCDSYECLRHAGFESTLSACYDLANTPRKILGGRDSAERVVRRMKRRRLDPRKGRWNATERLCPPNQPLPEVDVVRRWVHQLLSRWGIVSRDVLDSEAAAPPWRALVREFKRLELLGKVVRGYFIESHSGEHYGLPEAIELLRDCRARRSEGRELGYLPDEPVFAVTFHDPANLYGSCLHMVDGAGNTLERSRKLGFRFARMAIQGGQPLVLAHGQQLAPLTPRQLSRCVEELKHDHAGQQAPTKIGEWNGYPIETHPVSRLLTGLGFGLSDRAMCWPPPDSPAAFSPPPPEPEQFLPYYADPPPVDFGPDWTVSQSPESMRPLLEKLLPMLERELDRGGWEIEWQSARGTYRDMACLDLTIRASRVWVRIGAPGVTGFRGTAEFPAKVVLETPADVDGAFLAALRRRREVAEEYVDRYWARRGQ